MQVIDFHDAKTNFCRLVSAASKGEEFIIAKAGVPMARLVPLAVEKIPRRFGALKGKIRVSDDFDAPLTDSLIVAFSS